MKLFKVILKGMQSSWTGTAYGTAYVVAPDPTTAYQMVYRFVKENDLGFDRDRELQSVELIADTNRYGKCGHMLHLPKDDTP